MLARVSLTPGDKLVSTTLLDSRSAATCPRCGGELALGATQCSACEVRKGTGGTQNPAAKAILGVAWFCTAVAILWFFGSLVLAPWQAASRVGPMLLPGGGQFDLTLGRGATAHCAVQVTRDGKSSEVEIMQGACNRFAAHRWLVANREHPQLRGGTLSTPYTVTPPPEAEAMATRTRVVVSCLFSLAAGLAGGFLVVGSIYVATRLMAARSEGGASA
jgi:hypothetical protein